MWRSTRRRTALISTFSTSSIDRDVSFRKLYASSTASDDAEMESELGLTTSLESVIAGYFRWCNRSLSSRLVNVAPSKLQRRDCGEGHGLCHSKDCLEWTCWPRYLPRVCKHGEVQHYHNRLVHPQTYRTAADLITDNCECAAQSVWKEGGKAEGEK